MEKTEGKVADLQENIITEKSELVEAEEAPAEEAKPETPKFSEKQLVEQERAVRLERNGQRMAEMRKFDEAMDSYVNARRIFKKINDTDGLGRVAFYMGECLENQEKNSEAAEQFRLSREYFRKLDDKSRFATAADRLAKTQFWKGDAGDAVKEYDDAIEFGCQSGEIFNNQAFILMDEGDLDKAKDRLEKALEIREKEDSPEIHITYNNLGVIEYMQGNHKRAEELFATGIEKDKRLPENDRSIQFCVFHKPEFRGEKFENHRLFRDVDTKACLMVNRASAAETLEDQALADEMLDKAMDMERDFPYPHEVAGWIYLGRNDEKRALDHFKRALPHDSTNDELRKVIGMINPYINVKVGRNEPCPCGSGKKYKKCHGAVV